MTSAISPPKPKLRKCKKPKQERAKPTKHQGASDRSKRRERWRRINAKFERIRKKREAEADICRIDADVLAIQGVARYLKCSVQAVRNIPVGELPRTRKPGKRLLFLREDVNTYVRRHQTQVRPVDMNSRSFDEQLDSEADNVRRRST